jgi:hypothetical protein
MACLLASANQLGKNAVAPVAMSRELILGPNRLDLSALYKSSRLSLQPGVIVLCDL